MGSTNEAELQTEKEVKADGPGVAEKEGQGGQEGHSEESAPTADPEESGGAGPTTQEDHFIALSMSLDGEGEEQGGEGEDGEGSEEAANGDPPECYEGENVLMDGHEADASTIQKSVDPAGDMKAIMAEAVEAAENGEGGEEGEGEGREAGDAAAVDTWGIPSARDDATATPVQYHPRPQDPVLAALMNNACAAFADLSAKHSALGGCIVSWAEVERHLEARVRSVEEREARLVEGERELQRRGAGVEKRERELAWRKEREGTELVLAPGRAAKGDQISSERSALEVFETKEEDEEGMPLDEQVVTEVGGDQGQAEDKMGGGKEVVVYVGEGEGMGEDEDASDAVRVEASQSVGEESEADEDAEGRRKGGRRWRWSGKGTEANSEGGEETGKTLAGAAADMEGGKELAELLPPLDVEGLKRFLVEHRSNKEQLKVQLAEAFKAEGVDAPLVVLGALETYKVNEGVGKAKKRGDWFRERQAAPLLLLLEVLEDCLKRGQRGEGAGERVAASAGIALTPSVKSKAVDLTKQWLGMVPGGVEGKGRTSGAQVEAPTDAWILLRVASVFGIGKELPAKKLLSLAELVGGRPGAADVMRSVGVGDKIKVVAELLLARKEVIAAVFLAHSAGLLGEFKPGDLLSQHVVSLRELTASVGRARPGSQLQWEAERREAKGLREVIHCVEHCGLQELFPTDKLLERALELEASKVPEGGQGSKADSAAGDGKGGAWAMPSVGDRRRGGEGSAGGAPGSKRSRQTGHERGPPLPVKRGKLHAPSPHPIRAPAFEVDPRGAAAFLPSRRQSPRDAHLRSGANQLQNSGRDRSPRERQARRGARGAGFADQAPRLMVQSSFEGLPHGRTVVHRDVARVHDGQYLLGRNQVLHAQGLSMQSQGTFPSSMMMPPPDPSLGFSAPILRPPPHGVPPGPQALLSSPHTFAFLDSRGQLVVSSRREEALPLPIPLPQGQGIGQPGAHRIPGAAPWGSGM